MPLAPEFWHFPPQAQRVAIYADLRPSPFSVLCIPALFKQQQQSVAPLSSFTT
jgi:hypothetical protein